MNFKKRIGGVLVSAGTTLAMVIGLGVGVAHADPVPATPERPIAMMGSDTTTPVMNALANDAAALAISTVRKVASFNATGSATVNTHASLPACSAVPRADGSGAGKTALINSYNAADGCLQGSRSSSGASGTSTPHLVYIPFAREAISFAVTATSNFPKNISLVDLRTFYDCSHANLAVGTIYSAPNYRVMLPQAGSGTRSFWITQMAYSVTIPDTGAVPGMGCIQNGADENGTAIQEHNGTLVNNSEIVPFSIAQWASQAAGVISPAVLGNVRPGQIDSKNPFASDFGLQRNLFNVFPDDYIDGTAVNGGTALEQLRFDIQTLFKGAGSQMCTGTAAQGVILRFGFRSPLSSGGAVNCGDTTSRT